MDIFRRAYQIKVVEGVSYFIDIGWLRLVGSIKLQVFFAEYRLFYKALLQKRPVLLSILLTEATPYVYIYVYDIHIYVYVDVFRCVYEIRVVEGVSSVIDMCIYMYIIYIYMYIIYIYMYM